MLQNIKSCHVGFGHQLLLWAIRDRDEMGGGEAKVAERLNVLVSVKRAIYLNSTLPMLHVVVSIFYDDV